MEEISQVEAELIVAEEEEKSGGRSKRGARSKNIDQSQINTIEDKIQNLLIQVEHFRDGLLNTQQMVGNLKRKLDEKSDEETKDENKKKAQKGVV